ncbi:uncharacterized protein TNCV_4605801 [Trichonephila clavipes]|nr:uncharacterized protein TNCV_4605801 [Trichonephila clavipes]
MEVNALKAARKGMRTAFSLSLKKIETELIKENIDMNQLSILKTQFMDKFQRLDTCQNQISEQLLGTEDAVQEYLDDMEDAENYRDRYIEMCTRVDLKIQETFVPTETEKRSIKLPKIELKKFSGEAKDFLAFWSQFQKIHNDKSIAEEDKMQYLLQSVVPKSKAERLVLSFPATAENYPKAIDQLKERFGHEDLLVQIYVRELLNLVMKNAVSGRTKTDLSALYDELEGKLRSLESLGRTQEKYGDFLTPLVESCLPEEILMAWERKRSTETDAKGSRTLEHLMTFLRLEVQGEEMVQLAKSGFGTPIRKKDSPTERVKPTELMTASALASSVKSSGKKVNNCVFCEKYLPSENCYNARKISLNAKRQLLLRKGACFICLNRSGHLSKNCDIKNDINCSKCNYSHFEIMCPKLNKNYDQKLCSIKTENSLSSNCNRNQSIYFQTLCVFIRIKDQGRKVRVLIDTACENSYISESVTSILKATPLREETIIHSLFGGNETKPKHHSVYSIEVSDMIRSYACCFEVLSEKKICGFISKIEDKHILNELKNKEIILSDLNCKETEIGLLIGADNIGKLLTGNLIEFDSGLTAIETKLGWTVIGKVCSNDKNVMLMTSSLHVRNVSVKELWELDVLGITDPLLNENTKENFELTDFKNKMRILPDGRYEVKLPWKCNSENLPSNKELTWKRHLWMMNKLRNGKFFEDYKSVFRQWEDLNIIERVPEVELNNECHYLPHRPVIKLDSATTKIRPVFDASAREKGKPSLNDCLYKGVNLIELIPDILDRFRIYPVGIVADIEKAFLMLSVAPKDRDYLRFFSPCNEKQLVYRHCRVVFGVSSSSYLLNASIIHLLENCNSECKEVALKLKLPFMLIIV